MSLVGTRPPTVDEWELYEPHHRAKEVTFLVRLILSSFFGRAIV